MNEYSFNSAYTNFCFKLTENTLRLHKKSVKNVKRNNCCQFQES